MKKIFLNLLLFVCFISCSNKDEVNIDTQLSRLEINSEFKLDTINVANWDSLFIIGPYLNEKAFSRLEIPGSVRKIVNENNLLDTQCTLLFFKGSLFVSYSVVERNIADFTPLVNENNVYSLTRDQKYTLEEGRIVTLNE